MVALTASSLIRCKHP